MDVEGKSKRGRSFQGPAYKLIAESRVNVFFPWSP